MRIAVIADIHGNILAPRRCSPTCKRRPSIASSTWAIASRARLASGRWSGREQPAHNDALKVNVGDGFGVEVELFRKGR